MQNISTYGSGENRKDEEEKMDTVANNQCASELDQQDDLIEEPPLVIGEKALIPYLQDIK